MLKGVVADLVPCRVSPDPLNTLDQNRTYNRSRSRKVGEDLGVDFVGHFFEGRHDGGCGRGGRAETRKRWVERKILSVVVPQTLFFLNPP
jgi:hypothetical protein